MGNWVVAVVKGDVCYCILSQDFSSRSPIMPAADSSNKPPKKRGSPSDFQGQRADFLEDHLESYIEHSRAKTTPIFWRELFPDYWNRFDWRLPLTEEPPEPAVSEGQAATPEEKEKQTAVMAATERVSVIFSMRLFLLFFVSFLFLF